VPLEIDMDYSVELFRLKEMCAFIIVMKAACGHPVAQLVDALC
jgi:hypothetical protein